MNAVAPIKQANKALPLAANAAMRQARQQCLASGSVRVQIQGGMACIAVSGRFDFQLSRNFRNAYLPLLDNDAIQEICIELSEADYLDSSALGMLLLLNERAGAANKTAILLSASSFVSHVLEVANFSKIFNIKHIRIGNPSLLS